MKTLTELFAWPTDADRERADAEFHAELDAAVRPKLERARRAMKKRAPVSLDDMVETEAGQAIYAKHKAKVDATMAENIRLMKETEWTQEQIKEAIAANYSRVQMARLSKLGEYYAVIREIAGRYKEPKQSDRPIISEAYLAERRKLADEATRHYQEHRSLLVPGTIPVGGAWFDPFLKYEIATEALRVLDNSTLDELYSRLQDYGRLVVDNYNKGREYQTQRSRSAADSYALSIVHRFRGFYEGTTN